MKVKLVVEATQTSVVLEAENTPESRILDALNCTTATAVLKSKTNALLGGLNPPKTTRLEFTIQDSSLEQPGETV